MAAQVEPMSAEDPRSKDPLLEDLVRFVGYRPNALLTMARAEGLLPAILQLVQIALRNERAISQQLRFLLACEASRVAGCFYSAVHAAHATLHLDVPAEKLAALEEFATHPAYTAAERAALAIARAGGSLPVSDPGPAFVEARKFFDDEQIVAIVSAIAAFGWFNRWNSLMGSQLEEVPSSVIAELPWLRRMREKGHG